MKNGNASSGQEARPILVTGGSGFLGCNLADAIASRGDAVIVYDSLSRNGVRDNARWLKDRHGDRVKICVADIRDAATLMAAVAGASAVLHLAGQVAVTCSLDEPVDDFEVNARGTLNVLEAVRLHNPDAPVVFASTNKVYGRLLADAAITKHADRYVPADERLLPGVSEDAPLDLFSPYGCSKGTGDQYVHDYARVYGLRTAVLRMSCIYGPRQFGTEDQGWIAHFVLQAIRGEPITIYGDGLQVRDALHVSDAAAAWLGILDEIDSVAGRVFNLGGGPENSVSLIELIDLIAKVRGEMPKLKFAAWRPGDQPWYVSDIRAISRAIRWRPRVCLQDGLQTLHEWLSHRGEVVPLVPSSDAIALEQGARI